MIEVQNKTQMEAFNLILEQVGELEEKVFPWHLDFLFGDTVGLIVCDDSGYNIFTKSEASESGYTMEHTSRDRMVQVLWDIMGYDIADYIANQEQEKIIDDTLLEIDRYIKAQEVKQINSTKKYIKPTPQGKHFCSHCGCMHD